MEVYKINVILSLGSHHSELEKTFLWISNDYVHFHGMHKYFHTFLLIDFHFAFDPNGLNDGQAVNILYSNSVLNEKRSSIWGSQSINFGQQKVTKSGRWNLAIWKLESDELVKWQID